MMSGAHIIIGALPLLIGYAAGRSGRWKTWHGPAAAVIVLPIAVALGFTPLTSVLTLSSLSVGFLAAMARCP